MPARPAFRALLPLVLLVLLSLSAAACSHGEDADGSATSDQAPSIGSPAPAAPEVAQSIAGFESRAPAAKRAAPASDASFTVSSAPPTVAAARLPGVTVTDSGLSPMLIRTGDARVEVDSLERAIAAVQALAARAGAVVGSTTRQGGRDAVRTATMELRVPAARFDMLVTGLSPLGHVEQVNVHAEDVGEEFVDVTARMVNARRLEARLVQLLAARTGRLEDVLAVERELARVREEIERYEGRLRYLRTRVAVSTLSVTVHERAPLVASHPGAHPMRDALLEAWRRVVATTAALIVGAGALLPVAVLASLAWLALRSTRRRWLARAGHDAHA